jgi:Fe-S cluster assembly protein SufD
MGFTRAAVEELSGLLDEPSWLRERRLRSFEIFERLPLPDTKRDQDWRQVDLKPLNLDAFAGFEPPDGLPAFGQPLQAKGVIFQPLAQVAREHPDLVRDRLFTGMRPERDKFTALQAAFFSAGTVLYVPDGVVLAEPVINRYRAKAGGVAALPYTLVVAGAGSRFTYVDDLASEETGSRSLVSGSAEFFIGEGASVTHVALQRWDRQAWQFANQRIQVGRDATFEGINLSLGGRFSRLRMEVMLEGSGSSAKLRGLFFASGEQAYDFRTLQDHFGPNSTSDLLYKGALRDTGRSVYVGVVRVEKQARGTSANQANRNLLLSEKARATSEPILEIENNDIQRCSHGATVGPVDPEHLFYLESRGIPHPVAERMLVQGFLAEVADAVPVPYLREEVEQELTSRIG